MTQRERLIDLLDDLFQPGTEKTLGSMADYLLANGVVVPVRCKDCKFSCVEGGDCYCGGYWYEMSEYQPGAGSDGYCSYGERKGGD